LKDNDNIEDWYREELSNFDATPDSNVWDSLAEDLDADAPLTDENISEWYKKEVDKYTEQPHFSVWDKLSTKLDTSSVWDKLVVSLNRYEQLIWWRNIAFRGLAVALLTFGGYLTFTDFSNENSTKITVAEKKEENTSKQNNLQKYKPNTKQASSKNSTNNIIPVAKKIINNTEQTSPNVKSNIFTTINKAKKTLSQKPKQNNKTLIASTKNEAFFATLPFTEYDKLSEQSNKEFIINRRLLSEKEITPAIASEGFLVKKNKSKIIFNSKRFSAHFIFGMYARRIYLGLNFGLKNQGTISSINTKSVYNSYNQTHLLDYGNTVGATVGFIVSDNFNLETNFNFNSTSGYKREFSGENTSFTESLNLNYSNISVLAKKMNNKSTFDNKKYSTNLIAGAYAAYLTSATANVNGNNIDKSNAYNNLDLGIVLGIEQDRYISKEFIITPGIRFNQGLLNTANGTGNFNTSVNYSLEFNLGIKYIFLKKG